AAGVQDGDRAGRRLDLADCLGRRNPHRLGAAAQSAIITAHRRCRGTRYPSLCCEVPRDESLTAYFKTCVRAIPCPAGFAARMRAPPVQRSTVSRLAPSMPIVFPVLF